MRVLTAALGAVQLSAFACTAPSAHPTETRVIRVNADVIEDEDDDDELRVAVGWLQRSHSGELELLFSSDEPYPAQRHFEVELRVPPRVDWTRLQYLDSVTLTGGNGWNDPPRGWGTLGYRPRVVVYEDVDGDRRLDVNASAAKRSSPADGGVDAGMEATGAGYDRIMAVDDGLLSAIALLDPKSAVAKLSLAAAERFYSLTGGLSRFAFATQQGSVLTEPAPITLTSALTQQGAHANLVCGRIVSSTGSTTEYRVRVDDGLDAVSVCGLETTGCEAVDMDQQEVTWASADVYDVVRIAQCKRNPLLEALVVLVATTDCSACACTVHREITSYVTRRDQVPSWWPCGSELPYCEQGSLVDVDLGCERAVSDAGADAFADVGTSDSGGGSVDARSLNDAAPDAESPDAALVAPDAL